MTKKQRALAAVEALEEKYPDAMCTLDYTDPLQLLIATRLSAQCTDARVNLVTPELFGRYKTAEDFAAADVADVERIIHSCGFFRAKARDIVNMCKMLIEKFDSKVPDNIDDLVTLPGVGRKTANLIVGDIYGKPAVVADTHLIRISNLLGLVDTAPRQEQQLLSQGRFSRPRHLHFGPPEMRKLLHERVLHFFHIEELKKVKK